jgi:hypothetical protein
MAGSGAGRWNPTLQVQLLVQLLMRVLQTME